jgi:hypothetical protein
MSTDRTVIRPKLHHVNFKTNQLPAMIDWYSTLLGTEVLRGDPRPRDGGRALPGRPAARGAAGRGVAPQSRAGVS